MFKFGRLGQHNRKSMNLQINSTVEAEAFSARLEEVFTDVFNYDRDFLVSGKDSRPVLPVTLTHTIVKIIPTPRTYLRGGDFDMTLIKKRYQQTGHNDNLCFWRAMVFNFNPKIREKDMYMAAKNLFYAHYNVPKNHATRVLNRYPGFNPDDAEFVKAFEDRNSLNIELVQFDSNKQSTTNIIPYRRSTSTYEKTVYLLKENNHVMYIKDINKIVGMFECDKCGKYMASAKQLAKHRAVDCEYRLVFPKFDGVHTVPRSIGSADNCNNFVCYDFEAMLEIMDLKTKKSDINRRHVPISFAIASGIQPAPVYVIKKDPAVPGRHVNPDVLRNCGVPML